ncbi:MAG: hypothetical protein FJX47_06895 [Alphaproteobacteria bacterium]|nr:hypothetical protein [Alphaproteobacteria bacterium]
MTSPVKFMFDTSFGTRRFAPPPPPKVEVPKEPEPPPPPPPPTFSEEEVLAARGQAFHEGMTKGQEEMAASIDALAAQSLDALAQGMAQIQAGRDETLKQVKADAARLAFAIGRKLARNLVEREPVAEIEALIASALGDIGEEPRVVLRVPEALVEALSAKVAGLAAKAGFQGQVMLMGDASLGPADCRIEWGDGGAARSQQDLEAQVEAAIERFAAAPPAEPVASGG